MTEGMREKKLFKLSQVVLERIEDNIDNDDNTCMTEVMCEEKVVQVVISCL